MATEEHKKENLIRMYRLLIAGLAKGLYDLFGESSYAIMGTVGDNIVSIMEKEMGLEIGGSTIEEILNEMSRIFVDEFGFAQKINVVRVGDEEAVVKVEQCAAFSLSTSLKEAGVDHPFTCPIMNAMSSAVRRHSQKKLTGARIAPCPDCRGSEITFKFLKS